MAVAINAIRRLEAKIEDLTAAVNASKTSAAEPQPSGNYSRSSVSYIGGISSQPSQSYARVRVDSPSS
jgi:hypothetical protein